MRYRVVFRERTDRDGSPVEDPSEFLNVDLADGIVKDAQIVSRGTPAGMHEDGLREDDAFLSLEPEVWEYDISDDRTDEFIAAMKNSEMVMEFEQLGEEE
jgi:hypothetical protein